MSIIKASLLTSSDLASLGNNLDPVVKKDHREINAVNRSLAIHGEGVRRLYRPAYRSLTGKCKTLVSASLHTLECVSES